MCLSSHATLNSKIGPNSITIGSAQTSASDGSSSAATIASGNRAIAIGSGADAAGDDSVVIGSGANANYIGDVVPGTGSVD